MPFQISSKDVLAEADAEIESIKAKLARARAIGSEGSIRFNELALKDAQEARNLLASMSSSFDQIFGS